MSRHKTLTHATTNNIILRVCRHLCLHVKKNSVYQKSNGTPSLFKIAVLTVFLDFLLLAYVCTAICIGILLYKNLFFAGMTKWKRYKSLSKGLFKTLLNEWTLYERESTTSHAISNGNTQLSHAISNNNLNCILYTTCTWEAYRNSPLSIENRDRKLPSYRGRPQPPDRGTLFTYMLDGLHPDTQAILQFDLTEEELQGSRDLDAALRKVDLRDGKDLRAGMEAKARNRLIKLSRRACLVQMRVVPVIC